MWMGQPSEGLPLQNKNKWPLRSETTADHKNASHPALGDKSKIYFQPLHIKFGLLKMSVTAMDRESVRFAYLNKHFPKSVRPRWKKEYLKTKTLVQNQTTEIRAWNAFEKVCGNFLRNEKEENYTEIVRSKFYHILLCGLTYHWNFIFCIPIWIFFLGCEAAVSDEHGERFHPGISQI